MAVQSDSFQCTHTHTHTHLHTHTHTYTHTHTEDNVFCGTLVTVVPTLHCNNTITSSVDGVTTNSWDTSNTHHISQ